MWKKLQKLVLGREYELRERVFRSIVLVGGLAAIIATLEVFVIMQLDALLLGFLVLLIIALGSGMFVTFKYGKYDIAAIIIGVIMIVMVFPVLFMMSGGLEGGPSVWMALGIFYIFLMP